jgi:hypothetical protein
MKLQETRTKTGMGQNMRRCGETSGRRTDHESVAKHRVAMNPSTRANDVVAGHYTSHLDSSLQHNLDFLDTPWALHKCMSLCITMHDV